MNKLQLIAHLEHHVTVPQPSERWAMYRLIAPVVDFANLSLGLLPYYEFNQTSSHGTHQSVDIALLNERHEPEVLVEAKRLDRPISPEQIDKYLAEDVRGIVTTGELWLLCTTEGHCCYSLFDQGRLDTEVMDLLLSFIKAESAAELPFSRELAIYKGNLKPAVVAKSEKAVRKVHQKFDIQEASELAEFQASLSSSPVLETSFLSALIEALSDKGMAESIRIEARKTRLSFFDSNQSGRSQRIGRIELGKSQPDILLKTDLVDKHPQFAEIAESSIADKGAHMRRFRLGSEKQATAFGFAIVQQLLR